MARPADNPMKRTLVIGGVASFIQETAKKKLARWGLSVEWHVPMGKDPAPGADPKCEVIVVFRDMINTHRMAVKWQEYAASRGLPCIVVDRHESHWGKAFEQHGIKTINPNTAAAVADIEVQGMARDEKESRRVVSLPVGGGAAPTQGDGFASRKAALVELLRDMRDSDGLTELLWSPEAGLSTKRTVMRPVSEETSEQL